MTILSCRRRFGTSRENARRQLPSKFKLRRHDVGFHDSFGLTIRGTISAASRSVFCGFILRILSMIAGPPQGLLGFAVQHVGALWITHGEKETVFTSRP